MGLSNELIELHENRNCVFHFRRIVFVGSDYSNGLNGRRKFKHY